jgi:uncharacterized repeat protein (TIGR04052 family)
VGAPQAGGAGAAEHRRITLRFKAVVGSQAFDCWTNYAVPGKSGVTFTPMDFRFYVQDVRLIARGGGEVPVELDARAPAQSPDVALVDLAADEGTCVSFNASGTNLTVTGRVPAGDYAAVVFTTSVPEELNHQDIATSEPPLNDPTMYWAWASGYRFVSAMLSATVANANQAPQTGVHIGAVGCTGSQSAGFTCSQPNRNRVRLDGFDIDKSTIVADFGAVIAELDLSVSHQCHGGEPECAPAFTAFGLGRDGAALETQRVFRLE